MSVNENDRELQELLAAHELTQDDPCPRCGYDIYQHRLRSPACVRCLPPHGFHFYSDQLDAIHSWRQQRIREL